MLQIAYVEAGDTPSVHWMRLCEDTLQLQPLGHKAIVRRLARPEREAIMAVVGSGAFADDIRALVRKHPHHDIEPDLDFYDIRFANQAIQVSSGALSPALRSALLQLDAVFSDKFPGRYRGYLKPR